MSEKSSIFAPMFGKYRIFIGLIIVASLSSCTRRALHNAQQVVTQGDSLWAAGQAFDDSIALAQANRTLYYRQWFYPDEYAHSAYHYGRLLRSREDPVSAMQVFINATHSRTKDFHILGRIYSNMGSLCHLAGEFPLSYNMYERSANMFLRNGDTLNYYYGLNDMAYELAEQKDTLHTKLLLDSIQNFHHSDVIFKSQETKAVMFLRSGQYEKAIHVIDSMQTIGYNDLIGFLMKAQAYEHIEQFDSAMYYAQKIVSATNEERYLISAYYILSHYNSNLSVDSVLSLTSDRADAQKSWAIHHAYYANAIQLLQFDLTKKIDLTWLYAILVTMMIIGTTQAIIVYKKRKKHGLLTQQCNDLKQTTVTIQKRNDELTMRYVAKQKQIENEVYRQCLVLRNNTKLTKELAWSDFEELCRIIDNNFYLFATKLRRKQILNETEIRLCFLVLLDLNRADIAQTLPYALSSVGKLKDHTAKLLGTTGKNLRSFLLKMVIER